MEKLRSGQKAKLNYTIIIQIVINKCKRLTVSVQLLKIQIVSIQSQ